MWHFNISFELLCDSFTSSTLSLTLPFSFPLPSLLSPILPFLHLASTFFPFFYLAPPPSWMLVWPVLSSWRRMHWVRVSDDSAATCDSYKLNAVFLRSPLYWPFSPACLKAFSEMYHWFDIGLQLRGTLPRNKRVENSKWEMLVAWSQCQEGEPKSASDTRWLCKLVITELQVSQIININGAILNWHCMLPAL